MDVSPSNKHYLQIQTKGNTGSYCDYKIHVLLHPQNALLDADAGRHLHLQIPHD